MTPAVTAPDRRRLIAVVYADMVGYSRLIGLDDAGTLERLRRLRREVIDPAVATHGGRIVQTGGDSLLIVFDSIDGAVRCAVAVQRQILAHDREQPPDRAMRFRVGINIGDAIADGTDLHGDVVNVAARLQAVCPPGGICVSRAVRDHVRGQADLAFVELGALELKNIGHPVEAFLVGPSADAPQPASGQPPTPRPSRRRLAILVAAIEGHGLPPEHAFLARGVTDDITADLSRLPGSLVVGRAEDVGPEGVVPDLLQAARNLGLRYVIHGSMQRVGSRVAVKVQLVATDSAAHIWADRFYVDLHDLADTQDEITGRLVRSLGAELIADANRHIEALPPSEWTADDLVMRGRALLARPFPPSTARTRCTASSRRSSATLHRSVRWPASPVSWSAISWMAGAAPVTMTQPAPSGCWRRCCATMQRMPKRMAIWAPCAASRDGSTIRWFNSRSPSG
jgi:class 3 adenylate cyclase